MTVGKWLRTYPSYRHSPVPWVNRVPSHWEDRRSDAVLSVERRQLVPSKFADLQVFHYSIPAVQEFGDGQLEEGENLSSGKLVVDNRVVLVSKLNPRKATVVLAYPRDQLTLASTEFVPLRAFRCHDQFLYYLMSSEGFRQLLDARVQSVTRSHQRVNPEDIAKFHFAWPPEGEQRAIAAFLDRETARIDLLIEKKRRLIELSQEKRAAVITQATTRGLALDADSVESGVPWLGRIPKGWGVMSLARLTTKLTNGYVGPTRDLFVDEGIPYLQSLHIKQNRIQFGDDYFVTPEWSRRHAKSILHEGDVLVVQTGDIGQVAHVPKEWAGANCHALIVCSPDPQYIEGQYLAWLLTSAFGEASLLSCQTGALHPHLNCGVIKHMLLPVPPLAEQRSIVRHVTHTVDRIRELETKTESAIRLLAERRAALISAAVTGQIDVREAA